MTAAQWHLGRRKAGLTQVNAARSLGVSQPYLSQLEKGLRVASPELVCKAAALYGVSAVALPLPDLAAVREVHADKLQEGLAGLGYPGFEHLRSDAVCNPAWVVLAAVAKRDLDMRVVEALPWVLGAYVDLDWAWLRDQAKLLNAQNRLGYLVALATQTRHASSTGGDTASVLSGWLNELEEARLAGEGTLCRDSMPVAERAWLRTNRPEMAAHWNLLTSLAAGQLPYVEH
jgi:transcriptional regulator with XRE-family HTH domain